MVTHRSHNPKKCGSIPTFATRHEVNTTILGLFTTVAKLADALDLGPNSTLE